MRRIRISTAWVLTFTVLLLTFFVFIAHVVSSTTDSDINPPVEGSLNPEDSNTEDSGFYALNPANTDPIEPAPKKGLVEENGAIYFYNDDGTLFTGGYKKVTTDGVTRYYFFQEDGSAFTGGYKEVTLDGKLCYFYFLQNGQAFTTGYKTVKIDDVTYYFFFESDGKAYTDGLKQVPFGSLSYSYCFDSDGKAVTTGWHTLEGAKYYFQTNGRAIQNTFYTIDEGLYYFDKNGKAATDGWFTVGNGYYYADEKGALATDTIVDDYKLDATGKSSTKYQIIQYVNQFTNSTMTEQEKIDALYEWLRTNSMEYKSSYEYIQHDWNLADGWVDYYATHMLDCWGGNCFCYSSLLALMVREATGLPIAIYYGTLHGLYTHGWICVYQDGAWYVYDAQQARAGEVESLCYKVPYPADHLSNGVGTMLS